MKISYIPLTLLAPLVKSGTLADSIDSDQTAQNVQSDLGSILSACVIKPTW